MMGPLQRLLREIAGATQGRSDRAVEAAVETLGRFADAKIIPAAMQEGVKRLRGTNLRNSPTYLAHEYLNESWRPVYHADVARAFAEAKLVYASSTELLANFVNLTLNEEQRALVAQIENPELRETLKDFSCDRWFRQDVFVRGARRMSEEARDAALGNMRLALRQPSPDGMQIPKPDGTVWHPDPDAYKTFFKALEKGPRTVSELLTLPGLAPDHKVRPVELVGVLVGTELAGPIIEPSAAEREAADRLNALTEAQGEIGLAQTATMAIPSIGSAIGLGPADFALFLTLRCGQIPDAEALAARFVARCRESGGHPIINGEPVEDDDKAKAAVTRDYALKIERLVPVWRMLGVV